MRLGVAEPGDAAALWGDEPHSVVEARHLPDLLVKLGVYKTFSEARRAGREGPIPEGFTLEMRASKRHLVTIWNPSYYIRDVPEEAKDFYDQFDPDRD